MRKFIATAIVAGVIAIPTTANANTLPHRPCKYEDSNYCVWDAKHMGNGIGKSFWVGRGGKVHYVSHRTAHRLIFNR